MKALSLEPCSIFSPKNSKFGQKMGFFGHFRPNLMKCYTCYSSNFFDQRMVDIMSPHIFYIMIGGALGAAARYVLSEWTYSVAGVAFPWGTLAVNSLGSLLMGLLWGVFQTFPLPGQVRVFALVGFLGSFTTFSTFSFENVELLRNQEHGLALLNMLISLILGLVMVCAGMLTARAIFPANH
jgi:CrcB protein